MNKKTINRLTLFLVLPLAVIILAYYFIWPIVFESFIIQKINEEDVYQKSGFTGNEAEQIMKQLEEEDFNKDKSSQVLSIDKLNDLEARVNIGFICGDDCGSGIYYIANKVNNEWKFEKQGYWEKNPSNYSSTPF